MLNKILNFFRKRNGAVPTAPEKKPSVNDSPARYNLTDALYEPLENIPFGGKYDNYEGWPTPDWNARRLIVLKRDGNKCQAIGCIRSGVGLHAHHKIARCDGGNHRLENLVTLCDVHHAIVHLDTNTVRVDNPKCTIVSRHWRRKPNSTEKTEVSIHIRRHTPICVSELTEIRKIFGLKCLCGFEGWKGNFRERFLQRGLIWTWCPKCNGRWEFEQGLLEETASQLAAAFPPSKNIGTFTFDLNLIRGLEKPILFEGCPECLRHGRQGYLKQKKGMFGLFKGCSEWPICRYPKTTPIQND